MMRSAVSGLRALPVLRLASRPVAATAQTVRFYAVKLPKRPSTAYNLFVKANHSKSASQAKKAQDVLRILGEEWVEMGDAEKASYTEAAAEEKAEYEKAMADLKASQTLPPKIPK